MTKRSGDGGIWRLRWSVEDGVYSGFVVGHPAVKATASTFESLDKALCDAVSSKLQGGEWTADWDPPPPTGEEAVGHSLSTHVLLQGEGRFVTMMAPTDVFLSYCGDCGSPTGSRTDRPLEVWIEDTANLCFDFGTAPGHLHIVSDDLAASLLRIPGARDWIAFRPCVRLGRGRKRFCEALLKTGIVAASPQLMKTPKDWSSECSRCGVMNNFAPMPGRQPTHYYLRRDIPDSRGLFCVSPQAGSTDICVPIAWWRKHAATAICRGVISYGIGVADETKLASGTNRRSVSELASYQRHALSWRKRQAYFADSAGIPGPDWK